MRIIVTSFMRLNSERTPSKLLATVGERSLAEIMLGKLLELKQRFPDDLDVAAAVCPTDGALVEIAQRLGCPVLERSTRSRDGECHESIYGELRERLQRDYRRLVWVNPCQPFLRTETIEEFVREEILNADRWEHCRIALLRHRGWVWSGNFQIMQGDHTSNTKTNPQFCTMTHALFSYPVAALGTAAQMDYRHFQTFEPGPEFIDIDTPEDLHFARCYAAGLAQLASGAREAR